MSLLGKLAGGIIRGVTHGAIRPNFDKPSRGRQLVGGRSNASLLGFGEAGFGAGYDSSTGSFVDTTQQPMTNIGLKGPARPIWKGYHLNKTGFFTRGGGTSPYLQKVIWHEKGTVMVRNRHRHVGNTRALRKAFGRVKGFAHLAHRVITFTHHVKPKKAGKK